MRHYTFFILLLAALGLTSCDKDETSQQNDLIVGTWETTAVSGAGKSSTEVQGYTAEASFTSRMIQPTNYTVSFTEDGQATGEGMITFELTSTTQGFTETHIMTMTDVVTTGAYELAGGKLIGYGANGDTNESDVLVLTDSELVLDIKVDTDEVRDGARLRSKQSVKYTFARVN